MKKYLVIFTSFFALCLINVSTAVAILPECSAKTGAKISNKHAVSDGVRTITIQGCPLQVTKPIKMAVAYEGGGGADSTAGGTPGVGQIQVIGTAITYGAGGPAVPVRLDSKLTGTDVDYVPRFSGANLQVYDANNPAGCSSDTPSTCVGIETVALGSNTASSALTFRGKAAYPSFANPTFHQESLSDGANSLVLIDGDNINDLITQKGIHPPYGGQVPIKDIIAPYIDASGNVYLDPNRILILFELGTANVNSAAYDFQDLVIALDLDGIVTAPDYVFPLQTAIGSPSYPPNDGFNWSMVRAAPGGSRIKGLAYQVTAIPVGGSPGNRTIRACIAASGTNPSWTNCTLGTVFPTTANVSGDQKNAVDMAMTDGVFHGVGWVRYNSVSGLTKYLISFTKDSGVTWDAAPREVGHYTEGSSLAADDIDVASNEMGSIGVLAYYKQSGSPAPNPTEPDSLVLYTYKLEAGSVIGPVKTVIVTGSGAQTPSLGCAGVCFALTGDGNDTFQAFYYQGGVPKVTAITNASTTPATATRTITNNSAVTTIQAASTAYAPSPYAGAAVIIPSGTGMGTYDVPVSGNIVLRTTNILDEFMDNSVQTLALTRLYGGGAAIGLGRMSATGTISVTTKINDTLLYPVCPSPLTAYSGAKCAAYTVTGTGTLRHGATVVGNVYYASSFLQEMDWSTVPNPDQYLATVQRIVIHQTSAEP